MKVRYITLKRCLTRRVARLKMLEQHFTQNDISNPLKDEFCRQQVTGNHLIKKLRTEPYDIGMVLQIENYFRKNERLLGSIVYEMPHEYCDLLAVVELFEYEREYIIQSFFN